MTFDDGPSKPLEIGTRITVYWPDDDQWYKGTVADELDDDRFWIKYDDGDEGEMNTKEDKWRRSLHPDKFIMRKTQNDEKKQAAIDQLEPGSRIAVYFPYEKEYYAGTLTKKRDVESKKGPHRIRYDDGDKEWTDLMFRKFKNISKKADELQVGSRVAVYDEARNKNYAATVVKIKAERARPHKVKYDKESRGKEWLNLHVHPFLDMIEEWNKNKRKKELVDTDRPLKRKRPQNQEESGESEAVETEGREETCAYCKTLTDAPHSTTCHHIFCKACVDERIVLCPLCNTRIDSAPVSFAPDHVSFKAVEALSKTTAEVQLEFPCASSASIQNSRFNPTQIIEACQSKRRDDREHMGYYWRFKGSKDRILRVGESVKDGIPVEQVDLETSNIIATFPSGRKAHEATGISRCTIKRVLQRRGKANGGGYFWRYQGETHKPWPDPPPTNLKPVEQLDWETGEVLDSYESLAEAKRKMCMPPNRCCIREVCDGERATADGYFWRWKGSDSLPNHLIGVSKVLEIRKKRNGKVVKTFKNSKDAQAFFGHQCCWSTICRYCRDEDFYLGYYWRYRMLSNPLSTGEALIGKRLRVKQAGNDWLGGKIKRFCSDSGEHEILYDSGRSVRRCLEQIEYEWKNDQGQKPIEQLDLKTGQVLASFESASLAARSIPGGIITRISAVCTGRCKSAHGYFWRYKGSTELPKKKKGRRKIEQLCLKTGRVVGTFDTIRDAAKEVGITTPGISYCCNGRNHSKSAGGFGWRFSKEDDN